jgi:hypothetical protein
MSKTATAKNLNATFAKKKVTTQQDKDTKALNRKLAKLPICPIMPVPDATYLVKKSTKEQLAAQVVELTKGLNGANKSIETLGNQSILALHDLGIAKRTIKAMKKGAK